MEEPRFWVLIMCGIAITFLLPWADFRDGLIRDGRTLVVKVLAAAGTFGVFVGLSFPLRAISADHAGIVFICLMVPVALFCLFFTKENSKGRPRLHIPELLNKSENID